MNHEFYQEMMSAYLDNELKPEQKAMFEQYLAEHPELQAEIDAMRGLDDLVDRHSDLSGDDYWERSASKIEQRLGIAATKTIDISSSRSSRAGMWWKYASAVAAVLVLGFVSLHQSDIFRAPGINETDEVEAPPSKREAREETTTKSLPPAAPVAVPEADQPESRTVVTPAPTAADEVGANRDAAELEETALTGRPRPEAGAGETDQPRRRPTATAPAEGTQSSEPNVLQSVEAESAKKAGEVGLESSTLRVPAVSAKTLATDATMEHLSDQDESEVVWSTADQARLDDLRIHRDSLVQTLANKNQTAPAAGSIRGNYLDVAKTSLQSAPPRPGADTGVIGQLVSAWADILQISSDSLEIEAGFTFLEGVAADSTSPYQATAASRLRDLKRR